MGGAKACPRALDVPFGIDWEVLPSIDRPLVSTPLVVDATHDSSNDLGVQAYAELPWMTSVVFAVNGWDYEAGDSTFSADAAVGGRVGLKPGEGIELGGSFAWFDVEGDGRSMSLAGADLQVAAGPLAIRGEFIQHDIEMDSLITGGVGWRILENCEMRFEYQSTGEDAGDRAFLQVVAGF